MDKKINSNKQETVTKNYVFVKASVCWADEFDCEMIGVFTKDNWDKKVQAVKDLFAKRKVAKEDKEYEWEPDYKPVTIYFGTNEELEITSAKDWIDECEVTPINEIQAKTLALLFDADNKNHEFTFGTGSGFFDIVERVKEDEEDNED